MARKIIYLINPVAGTRKKQPLTQLIEQRTKAENIPFELLPTNVSGDYHHLKQKIHQEKITDIVICGGDGTISAVAAALRNVDITIGIIPAGSGNGLARSAKISTNPSRALDVIFVGKASYIDAFYINGVFSCMLCGIGFDAQIAHAFSKEKERGLRTYVRLSFSHFFNAKSFPFELCVGETVLNTSAFFISIANSNQFGNGFTIAPQANMSDGLLDIVVVKKMNRLKLPFAVLAQVLGLNKIVPVGRWRKGIGVHYFQASTLKITNSERAPLHIDGDPKDTAETFHIEVVQNAIRLLQP